jgi:ABC-type transport system involved in multi-copper enzyme maturation permease subunit
MTGTIIFYLVCAGISYLFFQHKYRFSHKYSGRGLEMQRREWLLVFLPVANYFVAVIAILGLILGTAIFISEYFKDNR